MSKTAIDIYLFNLHENKGKGYNIICNSLRQAFLRTGKSIAGQQ